MKVFCLPPLISIILVSAATSLTAQVTFNFDTGTAGTDLEGLLGGTTVSGGITLTATGFPDGFFNVTASGFGLNAAVGSDDTDEFDPGEGFTFNFDTNIYLSSIAVSQFGGGTSQGTLVFDGGSTIASITSTGVTTINNTYVASGTTLRFTSTGSTPFSVDNIVVTAVPEPSTYAAILGGVALVGVIVMRRRQPPANAA